MRKLIGHNIGLASAIIILILASATSLPAQTYASVPGPADSLSASRQGYELTGTVDLRQSAKVDSSLVGKNIFNLLPVRSSGGNANVFVYQSASLLSAMNAMVASNLERPIPGYRVRIFSDNKQTARADAEAAMKAFEADYPTVAAYMSYTNPYFKVTVGDFRTRSEAIQFMKEIIHAFPSAFVVKEGISYPN